MITEDNANIILKDKAFSYAFKNHDLSRYESGYFENPEVEAMYAGFTKGSDLAFSAFTGQLEVTSNLMKNIHSVAEILAHEEYSEIANIIITLLNSTVDANHKVLNDFKIGAGLPPTNRADLDNQ